MEDAISSATYLVEHYQDILDFLKAVAIAYGSVKAAVVLNTLATKGYTGIALIDNTARQAKIALMRAEAVATGQLSAQQQAMTMTQEAYVAYDSCLQWKPDNISCLNNYAYFLSEEDKDLDKAERMSKKTIDEEPENPTYLDTYAWILFKQQHYEEAQKYIDKVLELSPSPDATLLEHAGDIYSKTGNTKEAVAFWKKALEGKSKNAKLIRKKIKQRKYLIK